MSQPSQVLGMGLFDESISHPVEKISEKIINMLAAFSMIGVAHVKVHQDGVMSMVWWKV
jgi:hypothetical protein